MTRFHNSLTKSESKSAGSGIVWSSLSQAVRLGSQILGLIILARLLPTADFGVIAMASVATGFAMLFRDFGTSAALIQRPSVSPQLLDSVFWFNVAIGLFFSIALTLLAPLLACFFSEPRLCNVLRLLALTFPITASSLVHQALLERDSNFKPIALIESLAALLGLGSAVLAAWFVWGVYSLVTQTLVSTLITTVGLWLMSAWRPGINGSYEEIKGLWNFSKNLVGFNVLGYFARNADSILVGRFLGATDLGIYTMAYRLMLWPLQNISGVVSRALFPVFSRMQDNPERLAAAYLRATAAITFISAPIMMGLFVLREPFIDTVMGHKWLPVANLLTWLAPVGLLQSIMTTGGMIFLATGRTDRMFRWGVIGYTAVIISFAISIHWGLMGIVVGYTAITLILFLPSLIIPLSLIGLKFGRVFLNLLPSVLVAFVMALITLLSDRLLDGFMNFPKLRLSVLIAIGILSYGGLSYIFQRALLIDIFHTLKGRK